MQSLQQADRIVVTHVDSNRHYVVSKSEVQKLLDQVSFSRFRNYYKCVCYSDMVFYVYREEKLLALFAYFEEGAFAWPGGDWLGDAELSVQSHDALSLWFHGRLTKLRLVPEGSFIPPPLD